jgi:hypothetical protein
MSSRVFDPPSLSSLRLLKPRVLPPRHRFFQAFLKAALRLDTLTLRAWLAAAPKSAARRSNRSGPLDIWGVPTLPSSESGAGEAAGEAADEPDRDEADGNPQANAPARI